jgi:glutathione S-transferase
MYKLYYYPNNASLAPHLILQELGVEFELELVDRDSNWQKSAEYLALNPAGRIPTLIDHNKDDLVLFESPAICVYLAESHPQSSLIPEVGDPLRAKFHQWMMYLTNTLQADLMVYFYPLRHTTDPSGKDAIIAAQHVKVAEALALLDGELKGKDFLIGDSISACDYFLLMLAIWADEINQPPLSFEHLGRYLRNLVKRDAVKVVCEKEGIDLSAYG